MRVRNNKIIMKKALTKSNNNLYHYKDLIKTEGKNEYMYGDCTWLRGDCSELSGNCSELKKKRKLSQRNEIISKKENQNILQKEVRLDNWKRCVSNCWHRVAIRGIFHHWVGLREMA